MALQRRPGLGGVAAAAATELAATADDDGGRGGPVAVVSWNTFVCATGGS